MTIWTKLSWTTSDWKLWKSGTERFIQSPTGQSLAIPSSRMAWQVWGALIEKEQQHGT